MTPELKLLFRIEDLILNLAGEQQGMSRSDFQSRCSVVAKQIIAEVRQSSKLSV